ncbi:virE domain protein [Bacteroides sp. CAG:709]|nr:virE domain protein [Bacteroides sp. CAG:709]
MFSVGSNVRNNSEPLKKVTPEYLFNALRSPKPEFLSRIRQLRIVRQINESQYVQLKQQLPYFVCASFNPPFRNTKNFAFTEYFIMDIDHICEKGLILDDLRRKIESDSRTMMCFLSPGEDGLKVIMKIKDRCYDAGVYSVFYKKFVYEFSLQYDLQQVLDIRTSDVTRACFMSVDSSAYYNPDAEPVDMAEIIDMEDSSVLLRQKKEVEESMSALTDIADSSSNAVEIREPDDDAMERIRGLLNMKTKKVSVERPVFVPAILDTIQGELNNYVSDIGFMISEIINIQYGKKIRAKLGLKMAEVNLFYGKRGFSVVVSPKTGTDGTLNILLADTVRAFIDER